MSRARQFLWSDPRRAVLVLRLLVLAALASLGLFETPRHAATFWSIIIVYAATNLVYLFFRSHRFRSAKTQGSIFLLDALVVSALVVARGSQVPQFIVAYFTLVLAATVSQGMGSSVMNALLVSGLFAAVTAWGRPWSAVLAPATLAQFAFLGAISFFMGGLADLARRDARKREEAQDLADRLEVAVAEKTADLRTSLEELRAARERLAASDRLATLGMLAAGIAHEVRNPLAAMRAALEEAEESLGGPDASPSISEAETPVLRAAVADCAQACAQLARIAEDLTTVARSAPSNPEPVVARAAFEGAIRLVRHRGGPRVEIRVEDRASRRLAADPGRLQQLLVNLAANALDAMEANGGTLTLAAEDGASDRVRLRVADTGCGMPPGVAEKAFEAFFTTKKPGRGTGLGLHLVREIASAHGATLGLESAPGRGTTFTIDWPATEVRAHGATIDGHPAPSHDPRRGRRGDDPQGTRADAAARAV